MDFDIDDGPPIHPWDTFTLATCAPLRGMPGFHVAPQISGQVLAGALRSYLRLEPDEMLLAVIDRSAGSEPDGGCVLTSKRICWSARAPESDPAVLRDDPDDRAALPTSDIRSVSYQSLPDRVVLTGMLDPALDLGGGRRFAPAGLDRPALEALAGVLTTIRRALSSGDLAGSAPLNAINQARGLMPSVIKQNVALHQVSGEVLSFHAAILTATPRVVVTRVLIVACVVVFVAMVVSGVSPMMPRTASLLAWGANLGVLTTFEGQGWRMLTATFLHGGLIHLAVNMWCLSRIGPMVERFFGHAGFTLLYLAAGIGGFLASSWMNPLTPSVGASGAIFGVIGGLLAFLLVHRAAIPMQVLQPMRGGVISFILYNGLFGAIVPGIDNAAHIGGLATGFVAGLMLSRPWPVRRPNAGLARQLVGAVVLAATLAGVGAVVNEQIRRDPEVLAFQRQAREPVAALAAYNGMMDSLSLALDDFDRLNTDLDAMLDGLRGEPALDALGVEFDARRDLDRLIAEARQSRESAGAIVTDDPALNAMLGDFTGAQDELIGAMQSLRRFLDNPDDDAALRGPGGFIERRRQSSLRVEQYLARQKAFFTRHGLVAKDPDGE